MYGKIFESMYDGTLSDNWEALVTFQQMIILSDADGMVDMTTTAMARRTGIPIEHIKAGIEILENQDPYSRTTTEDGRRIIRISPERPWGWKIVNHKHYRDLRTSDDRREYMREYMRKKRGEGKLTKANKSLQKLHVGKLANTDTDTDTDTYTNTNKEKRARAFQRPDLDQIIKRVAEKKYKINPEKFFYYYESNGWCVGRNKMKSWHAALAKWNTEKSYDQPNNKADKHLQALRDL